MMQFLEEWPRALSGAISLNRMSGLLRKSRFGRPWTGSQPDGRAGHRGREQHGERGLYAEQQGEMIRDEWAGNAVAQFHALDERVDAA